MSFVRRRPWLTALLCLLLAVIVFVGWLFANARAMPVVRQAEIALPFPADAPRRPVRIALMTDTHMSGPDNSPERMGRIVAQINALRPDLILLGGDYIGDDKGAATYDASASIEPFAGLRAPLGVVAVLGNHDSKSRKNRWPFSDSVWTEKFASLGITLLQNGAVRRGPIAVGGLKDPYTRHPDIGGTLAAMKTLGGAPVVLAHGPDIFPPLPDQPLLTMVGHTHCGQVAFPILGVTYVPSKYGTRYACGLFREGDKTLIVSGGVGTSGLPIRMFAPPDIWIVTVRPA